MKICHVNLAKHFSASERQTIHLIKQQLRDGYKLTVVARNNTPFAIEAGKLPCELISTRKFLPHHSTKIKKQCQLIHAHDEQGARWALTQNILYNTPYIITRRTAKPLSEKYFAEKAYQKASALVGLSNDIVDSLKRTFPNKHCVKIPSSPITYPLNQNKMDQIWASHAHRFLVMQATRLHKQKGFDITLEAARILQNKQSQVHFLLLGSGPEKDNLKKQAEGLKNVFFMSKQDDMGTWFASANLLIHPSKEEGLGAVILEAMAAGLPVIGSNVGGISDIIDHEHSGLLVEAGNAQALAEAIEKMSENQQLRLTLQANAKHKLKEFDINVCAKRYQDVYEQISAS